MAIANGEIGLPGAQIDGVVRGVNAQVELGIPRVEIGQTRHEPFGGKRRRGGKRQRAALGRMQPLHGRRNDIEPPAHGSVKHASLLGQLDGAHLSNEQAATQMRFEYAYAVADGGRRHRQLICGRTKA